VKHTGFRLPFITGWGATRRPDRTTCMGVRASRADRPAVSRRAAQDGADGEEGRYELRLKSVIVTPVIQAARPHAEMFDEEASTRSATPAASSIPTIRAGD